MDDLNLLFVGNSGSGKTALIQVIINAYYGSDYTPENILVINSIKEKGIAFYRSEVKTFCQTCSLVRGKKKIVVLDDIEHINEQSQQIFRTCLDKYKDNVHFLASCSDTQRVIENLQSALSIMKITPVSNEIMERILDTVCMKENIQMTEDSKQFIVKISNHSLRTLLNYLEKGKLVSFQHGRITLPITHDMCTNISFDDMRVYTEQCQKKDLNNAIKTLYLLFDKGYSVIDILDNYFIYIKLAEDISEEKKYEIVAILTKYMSMFYTVHEDEIELAFFTNRLVEILGE